MRRATAAKGVNYWGEPQMKKRGTTYVRWEWRRDQRRGNDGDRAPQMFAVCRVVCIIIREEDGIDRSGRCVYGDG